METIIFCRTDNYRNQESINPLFTFTNTQKKQVLKHIKDNLNDYFDTEDNETEFNFFKEEVEELGILQAIRNNSKIQATYLELESIAKTKIK